MINWARYFLAAICMLAVMAISASAQCPRSGIDAPDLAGTDITGKYLSLADYQGKWVYIDFWASWCKPCMRKLPEVVDMHNAMASRSDFAVISVSLDDNRTKDALDRVHSQYGIGFPVVYDGSGFNSQLADNWCVDSIPSTFLIDPAGQVYASDVSPAEAMRVIEQAQSQPSAPSVAAPTNQIPAPVSAPVQSNSSVTSAAAVQSPHPQPVESTAQFSYRMQLLDHAPSFGGKDLHQIQLHLPASALVSRSSSFKVLAAWEDFSGVRQTDEYRVAVNVNPAQPLIPLDVSITGDLCFFIDQAASEYVLELAVPAQYKSLHVTLSRYDADTSSYIPGEPHQY